MGGQLAKEKGRPNGEFGGKIDSFRDKFSPSKGANDKLGGSTTSLSSLRSSNATDSAMSSSHSQFSSSFPTPSPTPPVWEAMYDFSAGDIPIDGLPQLTCKKGDKFLLLGFSVGETWSNVQRLKADERGWMPTSYLRVLSPSSETLDHGSSLERYPWFHGAVTRSHAEYLLSLCPDGSFLVRESESNPGQLVLSVRSDDRNIHYKLDELPGGRFSLNSASNSFSNVIELVSHHAKVNDGLPCLLVNPAPRRAQATLLPLSNDTSDNWEIDRSAVALHKMIGSGQYGIVHQGFYSVLNITVAVKTVKTMSPADLDAFLAEAQVMKELKHPNLVQLVGVCTRKLPCYIITEFMSNGNLLDYLRNAPRRQENLTPPVLLYMARQVACGMAYMEENGFIHRDLAARNCLVGADHIVKIADFGLTIRVLEAGGIYVAPEGAKFPIKWTAPEGLCANQFSTKSDVWSYGVLLHELATLGQGPYPSVELGDVLRLLKEGHRMPQPRGCPDNIYSLMTRCWQWDPADRPFFSQIFQEMTTMFEDSNINVEVTQQLEKNQSQSHTEKESPSRRLTSSQDSLLDSPSKISPDMRWPSMEVSNDGAAIAKKFGPPIPPRRSHAAESKAAKSPELTNENGSSISRTVSTFLPPFPSFAPPPPPTQAAETSPSSRQTISSSEFPPPPPPINTKPSAPKPPPPPTGELNRVLNRNLRSSVVQPAVGGAIKSSSNTGVQPPVKPTTEPVAPRTTGIAVSFQDELRHKVSQASFRQSVHVSSNSSQAAEVVTAQKLHATLEPTKPPKSEEVVANLQRALDLVEKCRTTSASQETHCLMQQVQLCLTLCLTCYEQGFSQSAFAKFRFRDALNQLEQASRALQRFTAATASAQGLPEVLGQASTNLTEMKDLMRSY